MAVMKTMRVLVIAVNIMIAAKFVIHDVQRK
jgi:hypothetical protein